MAKPVNVRDIVKIELYSTGLSIAVGITGSYIFREFQYSNVNPWLNMALLFTVPHVGLLLGANRKLRQLLDFDSSIEIIGQSFARKGRKIPFKADGKNQSDIFMFSIGNDTSQAVEIDSITISDEGNNYTTSLPDLEYFIRKGWSRQQRNLSAFARRYWTKDERLSTIEYQTRMNILLSVNGLIIDRGDRRSGRYAIPPSALNGILRPFLAN